MVTANRNVSKQTQINLNIFEWALGIGHWLRWQFPFPLITLWGPRFPLSHCLMPIFMCPSVRFKSLAVVKINLAVIV